MSAKPMSVRASSKTTFSLLVVFAAVAAGWLIPIDDVPLLRLANFMQQQLYAQHDVNKVFEIISTSVFFVMLAAFSLHMIINQRAAFEILIPLLLPIIYMLVLTLVMAIPMDGFMKLGAFQTIALIGILLCRAAFTDSSVKQKLRLKGSFKGVDLKVGLAMYIIVTAVCIAQLAAVIAYIIIYRSYILPWV